MDTLSLTNYTLETSSTDRLYYDQYEYCMKFEFSEICCLRGFPKDTQRCHTHIETAYRRRVEWNDRYDRRINYGGSWRRRRDKEFPESTKELHILAKALLDNNDSYKLVNYGQCAFLYSNNLNWLEQISILPGVDQPAFVKAVVSRPRDTVVLKNPAFSNRTYFKDVVINKSEKSAILAFFKQQQDIKLSPGFAKWVSSNSLYIMRYMFVDHNHKAFLTMLGLICPRLVRKTVDIIEINN